MDFEQIKQQAEGLEKVAAELYRDDLRIRMLINSSVGMARDIEGPIDPEKAERDAADLALRACSLLAARILQEDAELRLARSERDRYRKLAEDTLAMTPRPMFVQISALNESPRFVEQVRRDQRP